VCAPCTLVCHPALRLEWFHNLGDDAYNQARIIFECFINEYELATAVAAPPASKLPLLLASLDDDSFLSSIVNLHPDRQHFTTSVAPIQSEFERYTILAQDAKDTNTMNAPLIWWKVHFYCFQLDTLTHCL
jgi:hypothetical protein